MGEGQGLCQQCQQAQSKYKCPRCHLPTCSLQCSKAHKADSGCSGKRNPARFCTLANFDDALLTSDFFLLEAAGRAQQGARRVSARNSSSSSAHQSAAASISGREDDGGEAEEGERSARRSPAAMRQFLDQARQRGIQLRLQPPGMTKHEVNTSCWHAAMSALMWRVRWSFPGAQGLCIEDRAVSEDEPLQAVLQGHLTLQAGRAAQHHALRRHVQAGAGSLVVLMRKAGTPANSPKYIRLDSGKGLREQLRGATVVEFPELVILCPKELGEYDIVTTEQQDAAPQPVT